jgi:DnaJ-class molecular chaperone
MTRREHAAVELTVSVKVPCQECGGHGYMPTIGAGRRLADRTVQCVRCSGEGLIPEDMPLSQFQAILEIEARHTDPEQAHLPGFLKLSPNRPM